MPPHFTDTLRSLLVDVREVRLHMPERARRYTVFAADPRGTGLPTSLRG